MRSSGEQTLNLSAVCSPLKDAGILQQVFTFLPGCWLFLGAVCSEWRQCYASIGGQQVCGFSSYGDRKFVLCGLKTTLYSAAVASPATARLASSCGLEVGMDNKRLQLIAGLHADLETLTTLRELGMPLSENLIEAVALSGRLDILQHLITEQQCPISSKKFSHYAARSGSISMLQWLRSENSCTFDKTACKGAAYAGQLAALQHLRNEGCDWNKYYIACYAARSGSIEVVDWLRQQQGIALDVQVMMSWAAGAGQTAMCQQFLSTGCEMDAYACFEAARCGRSGTLRWLREQGCPVRCALVQHAVDTLTFLTMS
jgi:hypothetical protein